MALITVSGEPGCRPEEIARAAALRLGFEYLDEARLRSMIAEEFGEETYSPNRAWPFVIASIVARLALENHLVVSLPGAELLFKQFPAWLRVKITASEMKRIGNLMIERKLDRPNARAVLTQLETERRSLMKRHFGRIASTPESIDLTLNAGGFDVDQMVSLIESASASMRLVEQGLLVPGAEAQMQFQIRLKLARYGMSPPGKPKLRKTVFGHPSEEIFANLLDFYRIAWEYEPHSFPIQWDRDGNVLEAFTPDFHLPEFGLYVELTTMKQANVTKKNRKIKLVRAMYPHVNIQVFYQKDIQNLIFKYGLAERPVHA